MTPNKDVKHRFDLTGMQPKDWFLGCNKCRFQLPARVAGANQCPHCLGELGVYDVKEADINGTTKDAMLDLIDRMQAHRDSGGSPFDCPSMTATPEQKARLQEAINAVWLKEFKTLEVVCLSRS